MIRRCYWITNYHINYSGLYWVYSIYPGVWFLTVSVIQDRGSDQSKQKRPLNIREQWELENLLPDEGFLTHRSGDSLPFGISSSRAPPGGLGFLWDDGFWASYFLHGCWLGSEPVFQRKLKTQNKTKQKTAGSLLTSPLTFHITPAAFCWGSKF